MFTNLDQGYDHEEDDYFLRHVEYSIPIGYFLKISILDFQFDLKQILDTFFLFC